MKSLLGVASAGEHCVLATRAEDSGTSGQFGLVLCNAIGTPVDSMYCDCYPKWYFFLSNVEKILGTGCALLIIDFLFQSQVFFAVGPFCL